MESGLKNLEATHTRVCVSQVTDWPKLAADAGYKPSALAALRRISLRQLERDFQKNTERTLQAWLNELRQRTALELIGKGWRMKAIADALGYRHPSDFSRAFKRYHGVTPSEVLPPDFSSCR